MEQAFKDGDVATWMEPGRGASAGTEVRMVAIRRDYGWKDGQWQVAIHGFRRVTDEFIAEHGALMEEVVPCR